MLRHSCGHEQLQRVINVLLIGKIHKFAVHHTAMLSQQFCGRDRTAATDQTQDLLKNYI